MPLFTSEYVFSDDYPTIEPSLRLDFANARALDPRITFTRASTATYVGRDGLIKTAGEDEPRFDHDPETGESLGLLIEESRTNLFTYSEEFDNSGWSKTRVTVNPNSITAPDGTLTADKITEDATSSQDHILVENASSSVATYTYSFFAKAGERSHIRVSRATGNQTVFTHYYTLENNGTVTGGGNITAYPNGWYRCYGQTEVNTAGTAGFAIRLETSSTNTIYNGDGTSGIYLWGAQYEQGSFATSYIPTSGSAVTRSADIAQMTGDNFSSWFNQSEGTFVGTVGSRGKLLLSSVSTGPNVYQDTTYGFFSNTEDWGGSFNLRYEDQSQVLVNYMNAGWTSSIPMQNYAGAYSAEGAAGAWEGNLGNPQTPLNKPLQDDLSHMWIGRHHAFSDSGVQHIARLSYYPKRLTNAQLQTLTQ